MLLFLRTGLLLRQTTIFTPPPVHRLGLAVAWNPLTRRPVDQLAALWMSTYPFLFALLLQLNLLLLLSIHRGVGKLPRAIERAVAVHRTLAVDELRVVRRLLVAENVSVFDRKPLLAGGALAPHNLVLVPRHFSERGVLFVAAAAARVSGHVPARRRHLPRCVRRCGRRVFFSRLRVANVAPLQCEALRFFRCILHCGSRKWPRYNAKRCVFRFCSLKHKLPP